MRAALCNVHCAFCICLCELLRVHVPRARGTAHPLCTPPYPTPPHPSGIVHLESPLGNTAGWLGLKANTKTKNALWYTAGCVVSPLGAQAPQGLG